MIVQGKNISYSYSYDFANKAFALRNVDLSVAKGELVYILGCNGSGKSTLVRHLNALLKLQHGELSVASFDVTNENDMWRLRRICGMVFQNPDNQFVSSVVEEDIAFGLENYEAPREDIPEKVKAALRIVDMEGYEKRAPNSLSGGQKQRVALAGVIALDPEIIIFDEATAMLDPDGRREVLAMMRRLNCLGKTIVAITHYVEEAVHADRVILMHEGAIIASGTPRDILTNGNLLNRAELLPPMPVRVYYDLLASGIRLSSCPLTNEELAEKICELRSKI